MAVPTINAVELDGVSAISFTKDANIIPLPLPGSDSDATETFDMLGVTKVITLNGVYAGETAAVKSDIDILIALIDGDQDASIDFISDQTGTLSVKIASVDVSWEIPGNKANYTLKMIEGV
jgi:hypothetical protein